MSRLASPGVGWSVAWTVAAVAAMSTGWACSSSSGGSAAQREAGADAGADAPGHHDAVADTRTSARSDAPAEASSADACALSPTCNACLDTDPANCGTCGHSCGKGGSCSAGMCTKVLATGQSSAPNAVVDLIIDDQNVYWIPATAAPGSVVSVPKGGGTVATLASGVTAPEGLAQDDANLYFVSHYVGIESLPKAGGTATFILRDASFQSGLTPEFWLLVSGTDIFYVGGASDSVYRTTTSGVAPVAVTGVTGLLGAPGTGYNALAVDDSAIYLDAVSQILILDRASEHQFGVVPGSSAAAGSRFGPTIALDDSYIYYVNNSPIDGGAATSLMRTPKGGEAGAAAVVSAKEVGFDDGPIAVDDTSVYWTHTLTGSTTGAVILSAPKAGGVVVTVATGCALQCPFALDATSVYWPTSDGEIKVGAKAP